MKGSHHTYLMFSYFVYPLWKFQISMLTNMKMFPHFSHWKLTLKERVPPVTQFMSEVRMFLEEQKVLAKYKM